MVAEFIGAIPPAQIEQFLDGLVPSAADKLAEADDEASLRKALELDPRHAAAAVKLGRILLGARRRTARPASCSTASRATSRPRGWRARERRLADGEPSDADRAGAGASPPGTTASPRRRLEGLQEAIAGEPKTPSAAICCAG